MAAGRGLGVDLVQCRRQFVVEPSQGGYVFLPHRADCDLRVSPKQTHPGFLILQLHCCCLLFAELERQPVPRFLRSGNRFNRPVLGQLRPQEFAPARQAHPHATGTQSQLPGDRVSRVSVEVKQPRHFTLRGGQLADRVKDGLT